MSRARTLVLVVGLLSGMGSGPAAAQTTAPAPPAASTAVQAPDPAGQARAAAPTPRTPPATTRAYVHVFLAFTIAFVLLGGYVLRIGREFGRLEEELARRGD